MVGEQRVGESRRRLMHLVPAPAVRLLTTLDRLVAQEGFNLMTGRMKVNADRLSSSRRLRAVIMDEPSQSFLDWRLNSDNDSRLHGQPSSSMSFSIKER